MSFEEDIQKTSLITGEQGPITSAVLKLSESIHGDDVELIQNIAIYTRSLKSINTMEPDFSRTADQIIQSGESWGCHEIGLIFVTILRAKGEKASYIQTFSRGALIPHERGTPGFITGHVFIRQQVGNGYRIINSTTGEITQEIPEKYVFGAEGLDSWDIGLRNGLNDYISLFKKTKQENGF